MYIKQPTEKDILQQWEYVLHNVELTISDTRQKEYYRVYHWLKRLMKEEGVTNLRGLYDYEGNLLNICRFTEDVEYCYFSYFLCHPSKFIDSDFKSNTKWSGGFLLQHCIDSGILLGKPLYLRHTLYTREWYLSKGFSIKNPGERLMVYQP